MPHFVLRVNPPTNVTADEAATSFYWLTDNRSSFVTALDPSLSSFGPVPSLSVDLVRIAVAVYAADRSTFRTGGGSDWNQRQIQLEVPVSKARRWHSVSTDLEAVLKFLTGDSWTLEFNEEQAPAQTAAAVARASNRVVLISGGADSAIGALVARHEMTTGEQLTLLSHFSASPIAPTQRAVARAIEDLEPGPDQQHVQVHLARKQKRIDGTRYPTESSSRSRSLLFLALGLAAASIDRVPVWIPENGFASLNPPLGPDRRGSLSTRTTHPAFLAGLADVLGRVGAHGVIENPFASSTKGEMFTRAAALLGDDRASDFLSATNSCAHTGQRAFGVPPSVQCGVCFGCVVRRASFVASEIRDGTTYMSANGDARIQAWLDANSISSAVRSFVAKGVRERDLIAMALPTRYPLADALDLCRRGIGELAALQL